MLASCAIATDGNGNYLMRKRDKEPDKDNWELFATYVQPGETVIQSVERRLREDGDIQDKNIKSIQYSGKYYDAPNRHPGAYCIPLLFTARIENKEYKEGTQWFAKDELSKLEMALDNKKMLQDAGVM